MKLYSFTTNTQLIFYDLYSWFVHYSILKFEGRDKFSFFFFLLLLLFIRDWEFRQRINTIDVTFEMITTSEDKFFGESRGKERQADLPNLTDETMLRSECDDTVGNQVESVRFNYPLITYIGKCCNYIYNKEHS